jgi:alkylated DNA repair protein (DNA oxidative demethylase)
VFLLRRFANGLPLAAAIAEVARAVPFRNLRTRGGVMSVAMTNCGSWGWHSDESGYRYVDRDPGSGRPWPEMPAVFRTLAVRAAGLCGFPAYEPDVCLVNRYAVGTQMGTHRDLDELDLSHPIVSVSIGLPATFLWYGARRGGTPRQVLLQHGDVLVWGASARAGYHGVRRVADPLPAWLEPDAAAAPGGDNVRYNLTFRRAR